jgi:hypothetical protein
LVYSAHQVNHEGLRAEALLFGRYLIGRDPSEALVDRYVRANETLFAGAGDDAVLSYARRHPWSIAMLDAAEGLRNGRESLLRKKLLVMTAIVETTPELVDKTEQRGAGLPAIAWRVGVAGARTAVNAAAGLALRAVIRR